MSYENPNSPKYIPTAARSKEVGDAMLGVVEGQMKEKEEAEQLEKDLLKADRTAELAWGVGLGEDFQGQQQEGVLNRAYEGTGKRAAELQRMIKDQPDLCKSEGCRDEMNQAQILAGLPDKSVAMLGTFESYLPILEENNVDKNQPLYTKMRAASGMIKKLNGFGSKDGYSVDIVLNEKDGNYTGSQELIFKAPCKKDVADGCPFGESGEWRINSETLKGYENNPESSGLLVSTPDWGKQAAEVSTSSKIFIETDKGLTLDKSFLIGGPKDKNGDSLPLPTQQQLEWDGEKYDYLSYEYDTDKIRAKVGGYISAEIDTMFDKSIGGPESAISMWNKTLSGTAKDKIAEAKAKGQTITLPGGMSVKLDDLKFINKDGTMDYYAADPSVNKPGTIGSIYAKNGELKPVVKELYKQVYTDHYMATTVDEFIKKEKQSVLEGTMQKAVDRSNDKYKERSLTTQY